MAEVELRDLTRLAREAASPAQHLHVARTLTQLEPRADLPELKVAVLATSSFQFLEPYIAVQGLVRGTRIRCYFGGFGQFETEFAPGAGLAAFAPDVLVLSMQPHELAPDTIDRLVAGGAGRLEQLCHTVCQRLLGCARQFRDSAGGTVIIANHPVVGYGPRGPFEAAAADGYPFIVSAANQSLAREVEGLAGGHVWDLAGLVRELGGSWRDERLWAVGRIPFAGRHHVQVASHLVRTVMATHQAPAKCLVLDLDNTLWGGVIGDDGMAGIQLGSDFPGNAYQAFQRKILSLADRGILLALVSKNEFEPVDRVFREHPDMLLDWDDIAAHRINWAPKSGNIREIARELNIGSDALVLFDDNPVERAEVRANAPEVAVIEVPADPTAYAAALDACEWFDQPALSLEDRGRTELYRQERQRRDMLAGAGSVEEFLAGLAMVAEVGRCDDGTIGRMAQLVGKTNQFNLTTRRHSQSRLNEMAGDSGWVVGWLRLNDRFGDQGLVAVGILQLDQPTATIDTFLMSCRVMNRQVEQALLAYLAEEARQAGCSQLVGEYLPTAKNKVVEGLYPALGFEGAGPMEGDGSRFTLSLQDRLPQWPAVITRE